MVSAGNIMLDRQKLNKIFNQLKDNRIIFVCAPAGYGKTVAVNQWIAKDPRAKAVLTVDEYDNNIVGFCQRFCEALLVCQPQNKTLYELVSQVSFQRAPDEFTLRAISALSKRKQAILAVDDMHVIHNSAVSQLLHVFIKRLPSTFSVILISRQDLPVAFCELWIKGQIARINADQFLFSSEEIMSLYKKRDNPITRKQANEIIQKTQGWAIGINALLLCDWQTQENVDEYLDSFIMSNVWDKWCEETREFMLKTAGLRELIPTLCNMLTGMSDSNNFLKDLVQRGAFITRVKKDVYRYHQLFQRLLQRMAQQRGEAFINGLLEKEGEWHLAQLDFYSAVDCYIRCKNYDGIAKCFEILDISGRQRLTMRSLLPVMNHTEVKIAADRYPPLLFLLAWASFVEGRANETAAHIDAYYARYPEIRTNYTSSAYRLFSVRMMDFRIQASQVIADKEALPRELAPPTDKQPVSLHMPMVHRGVRDFSELAIGDVVLNADMINANAGWMIGNDAPLLTEIGKAALFYEKGQLEKAYDYAMGAVADINDDITPETRFCALAMLVCILDALEIKNKEHDSSALEVIKSISQMIEATKAYNLTLNYSAFVARRGIMAGDLKAAEDWLAMEAFDVPTLYEIYAEITTSRAFIAVGKYDASIILLKKIYEIAVVFNRPLDIIEVQILLAIAFWKKKRNFQQEALEYLEDAVWRAYPYEYVQIFINDSALLSGMLHKLMNRTKQHKNNKNRPLSFIKMLYLKANSSKPDELSVDIDEDALRFTDKQKGVMRMLAQGKTHKDIADARGVKQSTIRAHIKLIYRKLDVTNVQDAVAKMAFIDLSE